MRQAVNGPDLIFMKSVTIEEAKTQLCRLVERVQAGEEIVIAMFGTTLPPRSARKRK